VKHFALISVLCVSLALVACGDEGESSDTPSGADLTKVAGAPNPPKINLKPGPTPKKLFVKDIKVGPGAVAKLGQTLTVQYVDAAYSNGETYEVRWRGQGVGNEPLTFVLGGGGVNPGWEIGLKGMKVGGRREVRVPTRMSLTIAKVYIVELLEISEIPPAGGSKQASSGS
jgi:peptidylprolyl isomerase